MYHIRILQSATRELERLDKPIARRIAERINWLAANLDDIRSEPYKGDLAGLYKRDRTERKMRAVKHTFPVMPFWRKLRALQAKDRISERSAENGNGARTVRG